MENHDAYGNLIQETTGQEVEALRAEVAEIRNTMQYIIDEVVGSDVSVDLEGSLEGRWTNNGRRSPASVG